MTRLLMQALIDALDKNDHYEQAKALVEIRAALAKSEKEWANLTLEEREKLRDEYSDNPSGLISVVQMMLKEKNT